MKRILRNMALALFALLMTTACSETEEEQILTKVPDDAKLVVLVNAENFIKSAGFTQTETKIKLPPYLRDVLDNNDEEDLEDVLGIIKKSGIELNAAALVMRKYTDEPIFIGMVKEPKTFVKFIEDEDFREKDTADGVTFYSKLTYESTYNSEYNSYCYIAINGKTVYMLPNVRKNSESNPVKTITRFIEAASDANFASLPYAKYIKEGNAFGAAVKFPNDIKREFRGMGLTDQMLSVFDGCICFKGNLDGNEASLEMKGFDDEGNPMNVDEVMKYFNTNAKIKNDALSYLSSNEQMIYALSISDVSWDKITNAIASSANMSLSDKSTMDMVAAYLKKLNGTVAMGIGITNGAKSLCELKYQENVLDNISFTLVVETLTGKAKGLVNEMADLIETQGMSIDKTSKGFRMEIPGDNGIIYCEYTDNMIIMANHIIKDRNHNAAVDNMPTASVGMSCVLANTDKLMRDLGLDATLKASIMADYSTCEVKLKVSATGSYGVVGNFVSLGIKAYNKLEDYMESCRESRWPSYYDDDIVEEADDVIVEEVVEDIDDVDW